MSSVPSVGMRCGRRRLALREELVDYVVERTPEPVAADADRQTVSLELCHVHLPKLANAGLIEYDRQSGVVHIDRAAITDRLERARATIADLQDV